MTVKEIFYDTQKINYYELFTHTLMSENKKVITYYSVEWHTLKGIFKDTINKEQYEALLKELENDL